ncbi:MAG: glycerol-3-phosphate 1-O-acyltransferase PlsY [Lentisphaeria bacterium]|nr:glycerol-3-phosphate 1-O-acyltransferase PlsY [Lentisphaeria bacterium]
MTTNVTIFVVFIVCYLIGSLPFGFIIGKFKGIDIRTKGSGNIGATNVLRTFGKAYGVPCFFLDFLKGLVPVLVVRQLFPDLEYAHIAAVVGTVVGHVFTCFLKFKGGKGVSTTAGAIAGLAPLLVLAGAIVWFVTLKLSGFVSLGSIVAAIVIPILAVTGFFGYQTFPEVYQEFFIVMGILVIFRHKANISRIIQGTESSFKKK